MICFGTKNINWHEFISSRIHFLYNFHIIISILFLFGKFIVTLFIIPHCGFQFFLSLTHQLIIKCLGTDTEKRCVIGQWIKYFKVSNTKCHHDIGNGMSFWKHIFNPFTGLNIPIFYPGLTHSLFHILRKSLSLSHTLHDFEGKSIFNSGMYQICHDIITGTNRGGKSTFSLFDKILGVIQPHIRSMRQSRNTYQIRKVLRLCIP